jgi:transposase-like protein
MAFPDKSTRRPRVEQLGLAAGVPTEALRQMLATLVQETIEQLLTALRDAWNAASRDEAEARLARLVATVRKPLPALAAWLEETLPTTLACYALVPRLQRRLRPTNSIELDHAEVRRRTRVIRIVPNEASFSA